MPPADGHPFGDEIAGLLLEAAFDLLAQGGWGDFSLRAVAESVGVAGSAASHRFGDRAGLVRAVCDAAAARERALMDAFLPGVTVQAGEGLAAALYEWLEWRTRHHRRQARACGELLLVSCRDAQFAAFGRRWAAACRDLASRLCPCVDEPALRAVMAVLASDGAAWLLLGDDPLFRLASGEALRRAAGAGGGEPLRLAPAQQEAQDGVSPPKEPGTKEKIVQATARIILERGVQALTHREIARRSEASLSSLTYHFASLNDLVRAGMQAVFAPDRPWPAGRGGLLAAYELMLQALRDPALAPLAAGVRRDLGRLGQDEAAVMQSLAECLTGEPGAAG